MKTTVYAVRDAFGNRLTYRYREKKDAIEAMIALRKDSERFLEVYKTTQDLPRLDKRFKWK